ncbi:MAG: hypothetical protein JF591_04125 [Lysobacter sp.]|nr:hypothetical protein [Lysobacter sp.]
MRPKGLSTTVAASAILAASGPAWASDHAGMMVVFFTFYLVVPWSALHLVIFAVLALFNGYRWRIVAIVHSAIAALGPIAAVVAAVLDYSTVLGFCFMIGVDAARYAMALLPMGLHVIHRRRAALEAALGREPAPP